jgi:hypothetical protein
MNDALRAEVLAELRRLPHGGPADDLYRVAYAQARLLGVDRQRRRPAPAEEAKAFALRWTRQHYPGYDPGKAPSA